MSGGHFDHVQYKLIEIADSIDQLIRDNKKLIPEDLKKYYYNDYYYNFSDETIAEFKRGLKLLREAHVYAQRIDWLVSGDDVEDTFHERLKDELSKLNENKSI